MRGLFLKIFSKNKKYKNNNYYCRDYNNKILILLLNNNLHLNQINMCHHLYLKKLTHILDNHLKKKYRVLNLVYQKYLLMEMGYQLIITNILKLQLQELIINNLLVLW